MSEYSITKQTPPPSEGRGEHSSQTAITEKGGQKDTGTRTRERRKKSNPGSMSGSVGDLVTAGQAVAIDKGFGKHGRRKFLIILGDGMSGYYGTDVPPGVKVFSPDESVVAAYENIPETKRGGGEKGEAQQRPRRRKRRPKQPELPADRPPKAFTSVQMIQGACAGRPEGALLAVDTGESFHGRRFLVTEDGGGTGYFTYGVPRRAEIVSEYPGVVARYTKRQQQQQRAGGDARDELPPPMYDLTANMRTLPLPWAAPGKKAAAINPAAEHVTRQALIRLALSDISVEAMTSTAERAAPPGGGAQPAECVPGLAPGKALAVCLGENAQFGTVWWVSFDGKRGLMTLLPPGDVTKWPPNTEQCDRCGSINAYYSHDCSHEAIRTPTYPFGDLTKENQRLTHARTTMAATGSKDYADFTPNIPQLYAVFLGPEYSGMKDVYYVTYTGETGEFTNYRPLNANIVAPSAAFQKEKRQLYDDLVDIPEEQRRLVGALSTRTCHIL